MAARVPVVVSSVGGVPDVIDAPDRGQPLPAVGGWLTARRGPLLTAREMHSASCSLGWRARFPEISDGPDHDFGSDLSQGGAAGDPQSIHPGICRSLLTDPAARADREVGNVPRLSGTRVRSASLVTHTDVSQELQLQLRHYEAVASRVPARERRSA